MKLIKINQVIFSDEKATILSEIRFSSGALKYVIASVRPPARTSIALFGNDKEIEVIETMDEIEEQMQEIQLVRKV